MVEFTDSNGQNIQFLFEPQAFTQQAKHVLVICKYKSNWLLTNHLYRGWEFPGGKVETGESLQDAARREVWEETGAILKEVIPIGSYQVTTEKSTFVKKVYFGVVERLETKEDYLETNGPVLVDKTQLLKDRFLDYYSFIMQDKVIELCVTHVENRG